MSALTVMDTRLDHERVLLGSLMILDRSQVRTISRVMQLVPDPIMYSIEPHQKLAKAIYSLHRSGGVVDLLTVKHWLNAKGWLREAGGEDYLIQVAELVPSASHAPHYAAEVRQAYARRIIGGRAKELARKADSGVDFDEFWQLANEVTRGRLIANQFAFHPFEGDVGEVQGLPEGIETGFTELDAVTSMGGIPKGQMTVIGATTGTGKSLIAQQIAMHVARQGGRVAYLAFGSDLSTSSLTARWIKQECGWFPRAGIHAEAQADIDETLAGMQGLPIIVYEAELATDGTVEAAVEWVKHEAKANPFDLVIWDYAQIIRTGQRNRSKVEQMEIVSQEVSRSAKPLGSAVILVSQMAGQESEEFRYSQQFEHDSGLAVILSVDKVELLDKTFDATLKVKKNRWGYRGGVLRGKFNPRFLRFEQWRAE